MLTTADLVRLLDADLDGLTDVRFLPSSGGSTVTVPWSARDAKGRAVGGRVLLMTVFDEQELEVRAVIALDSAGSAAGALEDGGADDCRSLPIVVGDGRVRDLARRSRRLLAKASSCADLAASDLIVDLQALVRIVEGE